MKKYNIPTAAYEVFYEEEEAINYLSTAKYPIVIKADGLALGKGVIIAESLDEAKKAVGDMMTEGKFGDSGRKIVVEEFLEGKEISVLAFTDGKSVVPMVSAMDHKRAFDGDEGLNTGGMGTVAPIPFYDEKLKRLCMEKIFLPTMRAMNGEGRKFKGCIYFGLMITSEGPKVLEYNCRFGDPEAQVVLPLLKSDLLDIMLSVENETLNKEEVIFSDEAACCVVIATKGYPVAYKKGYPLSIPQTGEKEYIFCAGVKEENGKLKSNGGRVLGVTAVRKTLEEAVSAAYALAKRVDFKEGFYRSDIGSKVLLK